MLWQESAPHSVLWLNNILLYAYTYICGFEAGGPIRQPGGSDGRAGITVKTGLAETRADSIKCANHLGPLGMLGFLLLKKEIM